ncbi:MAG: TetR/AcrR family transcriptional regulator [Microthrixaceae bacterium]
MTTERTLTERGVRRRDELVAVATRRFAADGYHSTSVADLVDEIGAGKGVFYWYFESKEALFRGILRDALQDLRASQRRAVAALDDPIEQIAAGLRAAVRWTGRHRDLATLVEFAQTEERFAPLLRRGRALLVADASAVIRSAIETGSIPDGDPEAFGYAMLGVSTSLTFNFVHDRDRDPEAVADTVVTFCLRGLGASC